MKDAVHSRHGPRDGFRFADISFKDFKRRARCKTEIVSFSCAEVVENANEVFSSEELFDDVGADESRAAGYKELHGGREIWGQTPNSHYRIRSLSPDLWNDPATAID